MENEKSVKISIEAIYENTDFDRLIYPEDLVVAKEILNIFHKNNCKYISSAATILDFCKHALNYVTVDEFI